MVNTPLYFGLTTETIITTMNTRQNTLREYRKRKGQTQLQVAEYLGFKSTDRISKWESGLQYPHLFNVLKLAKLFTTTVEELYTVD